MICDNSGNITCNISVKLNERNWCNILKIFLASQQNIMTTAISTYNIPDGFHAQDRTIKVIKGLQNGKAPGTHGINPELCKYSYEPLEINCCSSFKICGRHSVYQWIGKRLFQY